MSISNLNPSVGRAPADEAATTESLGQKLRAALPPMRLHSLSLHDLEGDVLWLSEGALGPDEHAFVGDALRSLRDDPASIYREDDLEDGRAAVFLAIRSPQAQLGGLVMILVDSKGSSAGKVAPRVLVPQVREILRKLAIRLAPPGQPSSGAPNGHAREVKAPHAGAAAPRGPSATVPFGGPPKRTLGDKATKSTTTSIATPLGDAVVPTLGATMTTRTLDSAFVRILGATAATPFPVLEPSKVDELLTFQLEEDGSAAAPLSLVDSTTNPTLSEARRSDPGVSTELQVQELARLRSGGRTRRFQLLLPSPAAHVNGAAEPSPATASSAAVETIVTALKELTEWLTAHRRLQEHVPLSFYVPLPSAALGAAELADAIGECVQPARIRPGSIGFQIGEALCMRNRVQADRLIRKFDSLGCALALDDFAFDSGALELLRAKVLRLVKVNAGLTSGVLRDRLTQARVVAILNAAKVLGIHCSAKRVDDRVICRWLARAGFEYAEGSLFERARPLASLGAQLAETK